jgi:PKD repeat protein
VPISFFDVSESTDVINSWLWDFGDGYFGNTKNPVHEYDTTGAYNVTLQVETLNGCVDSAEVTVNMSFTPNVDFIIENPCVNSGTRFVPNYGSDTLKITQWLWDFGDHLDTANTSIDSLPVHFYDRVDLYTVNVHMWSYDCKGEFQKTFIVLPIPYSGFSLVENYQDVQGRTKFINESIYATDYNWDFGNGNTTNVPDPIEIYEMDSTYLISLAAINEYGCADTSYYELEVFFKGLYFPTAFMPNGPNADISLFTPKGVNLKNYIVQVFDLRGSKLWESELLDENGSPVESWDGYYNDLLMPEGMYIWKAYGVFLDGTVWKGQTFDNETIKTNGVVTLIR